MSRVRKEDHEFARNKVIINLTDDEFKAFNKCAEIYALKIGKEALKVSRREFIIHLMSLVK